MFYIMKRNLSINSVLGEPKDAYLPDDIVGFTPFQLIDRQHASLESLRFFASQIVVVHNRLVKYLEKFETWQKRSYEAYVPAISDAWFLVEMYYQFWQICGNLGGFKKGTFTLPEKFTDLKEVIKGFRNHRQHIAQIIHDQNLDKPLGGALTWFHSADDLEINYYLISLEGSTRWLNKAYPMPRILYSKPVSSVTLVVGNDTLNLSEVSEVFAEAVKNVYKIIALSVMASDEKGEHPVKPGWSGYTRTYSLRFTEKDDDGHIFEISETFSAYIAAKGHEYTFTREDLKTIIKIDEINGKIKLTFIKDGNDM